MAACGVGDRDFEEGRERGGRRGCTRIKGEVAYLEKLEQPPILGAMAYLFRLWAVAPA